MPHPRVTSDPAMARLREAVDAGGLCSATGAVGSSASLIAGALSTGRPVVLLTAHLDDADEASDELTALGLEAARLPAMEVAPGESGVDLELLAERLLIVRRLVDGDPPPILVAPVQAVMQTVPEAERLDDMLRILRPGDTLDPHALAGWLTECGYGRVDAIETAGEFAIRGGIVDIFPPGGEPIRVDLFGDEIDALHAIDLDTMGSDRKLERAELVGATVAALQTDVGVELVPALLPSEAVAVLDEPLEMAEQARSYLERVEDGRGIVDLPTVQRELGERCHAVLDVTRISSGAAPERAVDMRLDQLPPFSEGATNAVSELIALAEKMHPVVFCQNEGEVARMRELLDEAESTTEIDVVESYLHRGMVWTSQPPTAFVPYHELLNRFHTRRRVRRIAGGRAMDAFVDLRAGDFVVHRDHGIAKFLGLRTMDDAEGAEEYLSLEFAKSAKLHVPASKIELVQKYVGAFHGRPELSTLGGKRWKKQREDVREAVRELAGEMLRVQAARESMPGIRYPADTVWQAEFEAEFPYEETEDQLTAIAAVKRDMMSPRPMDRLVCGDVGFGKTEVAIRAAFKAAESGRQVAVLVPTTLLAEQHERTFRQRFADYPFRVESLSRFKTKAEQSALIELLKKGQVDIVIGTHRLLSEDVTFADLGMVIVDEEQRFGVEHKQKLLAYRATCDVLTLTATPIPRTLHMSLLGLRDISSLSTPPPDRRAVVTEVISWSDERIKSAIERELAREGQIYFVHNRVYDIESVADNVRRLAPDARIIIGHGQMKPRELEKVMLTFVRGDADILVSTTIIESGIDIPRANTMFIDDAHMYGLSDLHQLRGRVGRYKHRAYCYLLLSKETVPTEVALKRLRAIESFSMLGAGFRIALRDLEIRGAGNILGPEQSGHIAAVGYEMYCQLLERAVRELQNKDLVETIDTTIEIGIEGSLPRGWIPSDARRMDAYRRLARAATLDELDQIERDLISAYGELPGLASLLVELSQLRVSAARLGIRSIIRRDKDVVFKIARPGDLETALGPARGTVRLVGQPDDKGLSEVYYRPPASYMKGNSILAVLRTRLREAVELVPS